MIRFLKVMDAPPTWKSEAVFATPRYLIRAGDGKHWLYFCPPGQAPFQVIDAFGSFAAAQQAAREHDRDHAGRELDSRLVASAPGRLLTA